MSRFMKIVLSLIFVIIAFSIINSYTSLETEGFWPLSPTSQSELASVAKDTSKVKISGIPSKYLTLPLREYCIFASKNTVLTGQFVNLDMITNVLMRGCRFMDLEIYSSGGAPVVSH